MVIVVLINHQLNNDKLRGVKAEKSTQLNHKRGNSSSWRKCVSIVVIVLSYRTKEGKAASVDRFKTKSSLQ